jgi:hypothetical protein
VSIFSKKETLGRQELQHNASWLTLQMVLSYRREMQPCREGKSIFINDFECSIGLGLILTGV